MPIHVSRIQEIFIGMLLVKMGGDEELTTDTALVAHPDVTLLWIAELLFQRSSRYMLW